MSESEDQYCRFEHLMGLDRILKKQNYSPPVSLVGEGKQRLFSLPFPSEKNPACNVVVFGGPGSGKSTLALEMAMSLRIVKEGGSTVGSDCSPATVLYFALEQSRESVKTRADAFEKASMNLRKDRSLRALLVEGPDRDFFEDINNYKLKHKYPKWIKNIISKEKHEKKPRKIVPKDTNLVLLPTLSPRPLEQDDPSSDEGPGVFWKRLKEIRNQIEYFKEQRNTMEDKEKPPELRMVVIDSLNAFSNRPISRYLIEQLFDLFREADLIGVFIAEDFDHTPLPSYEGHYRSATNACLYLADVVIRLDQKEDAAYTFRRIEIIKSRTTQNVQGPQQMKIRDTGMEIYPDMNSWYTYLRTESSPKSKSREKKINERLSYVEKISKGTSKTNNPKCFKQLEKELCLVHLVKGPKETGKNLESCRYLHCTPEGKKFLIVSFDESIEKYIPSKDHGHVFFGSKKGGCEIGWILPSSKGKIVEIFEKYKESNLIDTSKPLGYELWLSSGYLLPEEFVYFLYKILTSTKGKDISRVVLRDIGELPMRHPILSNQLVTGGSNYLPVILTLFRKLGVDCMFICAIDDTEESKDSRMIARSLSSAAHFRIEWEPNPKEEVEVKRRAQKPIEEMGGFVVKGRYIESGNYSINKKSKYAVKRKKYKRWL